jgi:hypothetical protein
MLDRLPECSSRPLLSVVSRTPDSPTHIFPGVHVLTRLTTPTQVDGSAVDGSLELGDIVEGGHHRVTPLAPRWVVGATKHDEPLHRIVTCIYLGHTNSLRRRAHAKSNGTQSVDDHRPLEDPLTDTVSGAVPPGRPAT